MTIHLPDCIYTPERFDPEQNIVWDGKPCICERLRACEQRVRDEERAGAPVAMIELAGYSRGYAAGVQAAREAVAAIPHWDEDSGESLFRACDKDNVLAAIDALRGESNG